MGFTRVPEFTTNKKHVIFILGPTGSGKTKLSVDLALQFNGEIINCDKIQVYKGGDIITNKASEIERQGIRHHLLGIIENTETDFTVEDFCHHVQAVIKEIINRNSVPIIAGGSNSYIEALVEDPKINFRPKYDCCFIWLDASLHVLYDRVSRRVDQMAEAGVVNELREMFVPGADYERGIRRAIGLPEMDPFFMAERNDEDEVTLKSLLEGGINDIKKNTCKLVERQTKKIQRLKSELGWDIHRLDVTCVHEKHGEEAGNAWKTSVLGPSLTIVECFLKKKYSSSVISRNF
ncbi:adenylate isopentenyltransferase 5, chloroplastic-like [Argentina anserina]|uniref:adenylate isopentenyltransferase 5, chloroplastic-like n=1 Tax=Argentina anserina TaxID=57926 RepID=UPI0021766306|nr:adenylate isopentenyltransferase 5, chloroplastic-like [Potentilla anserina]